MERKMRSISSWTWRTRWREPIGRSMPGSERSTCSRASAVCSVEACSAFRRSSICASTCARSWLSAAPTARLRSGGDGLSQLSVTSVRTPDLRPSQASRRIFQEASSPALETSRSNAARTSAKSAPTRAGSLTPRCGRVCATEDIFSLIARSHVHPKKWEGLRLRGGKRRGGFRFFGELAERGRIPHRQVRQNLAVNLHAGDLQPVHKLAVGHPRVARGGADSLHPELAVLPLFVAAVPIGETVRAVDRLLRRLGQLAPFQAQALCGAVRFFAARAALSSPFYPSPRGSPFFARPLCPEPWGDKHQDAIPAGRDDETGLSPV